MRGTIVLIHHQMPVVHLEDGHWCTVKLLGDYDVMTGDVLSGNLNQKGRCEIVNEDHKDRMSVEILSVSKYIPLMPRD